MPEGHESNTSDAMVVALKEMYDLYGLCAGRLIELQDWITKKGTEK